MAIRSSARTRMNWQSRNARRSPPRYELLGRRADPSDLTYPGQHRSGFAMTFWHGMDAAGQYSNLRFYGLGPAETYRDRLHGIPKLGVFESFAEADNAPYLVPRETGNHEGCAGLR